MTREEAIKYFRNAKGLSSTFDKVADIAIEALSSESVDVVRCKDCRWYGKEVCSMSYLLDRGGGDEEVRWSCEDDDFCSWGKRKGGDE